MFISNSTFTNNSAIDGGVAYIKGDTYISVINSTFTNNSASNQGGVFYIVANSSLTLYNSTLQKNKAKEASLIYAMRVKESEYINITSS